MPPRRGSPVLLPLGLILALLRLQAAHAQTLEIEGAATAQLEELLDQDSYFDSQADGPLPGSASATSTLAPQMTSCQSSAEADYGTLRIAVSATAIGGPGLMPSGSLGAGSGAALFEDTVTVLAPRPELSGTPGTTRVRVQVSGDAEANSGGALDSSAYADWHLLVRFGDRNCELLRPHCAKGTYGVARDGGSLGGGKSYDGTILPVTFVTAPLPFIFDDPFLMGVQIRASVEADADEEQLIATASSDLDHTLRWGGFVEVRDMFGEVVEGYEIESSTGIDWSLPVPEAGGAAPAAIAALGARAARSRARIA